MKRHADTGGLTARKKKPYMDLVELDVDDTNRRGEVKKEEEDEQSAQVNLEHVAELKRELDKMKDYYQRACRFAREAELRAERAENALDTKIGVKENEQKLRWENEELKKRVIELSNLLEEEQRKSVEHKSRADELARRVAELENVNGEEETEGQREVYGNRPNEQMEMGKEEEEVVKKEEDDDDEEEEEEERVEDPEEGDEEEQAEQRFIEESLATLDRIRARLDEMSKDVNGEEAEEQREIGVDGNDDTGKNDDDDEEEEEVEIKKEEGEDEYLSEDGREEEDKSPATVDPLDILRPYTKSTGRLCRWSDLGLRTFGSDHIQLRKRTQHLFARGAAECEVCGIQLDTVFVLLRHITGQHHKWMLDFTNSGISVSALDYWRALVDETFQSTKRSRALMSKHRIHNHPMYNLDLHLFVCLDPTHHKIRAGECERHLSVLLTNWNALSADNKEVVARDETYADCDIVCGCCKYQQLPNIGHLFSHITTKKHLRNMNEKGVKVCAESVDAWMERFRRLKETGL